MRLIFTFVLLYVAQVAAAHAETSVQYALSPVMNAKGLVGLNVEMRFDGEDDGDTVLLLPNEWGGKTKLYEGLRDLKIAGGDVVASGDPAKRIVRHRPRAKLFVSYRVVQNWPGEPKAEGANEYRPIVQPGYFHVLGNAVFITPERDDDPPASFELKSLPPGWSFASDLEHSTMGRTLVLRDMVESVLVGGDFRVLKRSNVRVALRGKWPFSDEAFADRLQPIIDSHHRFWGDPPEPFLVTALPLTGESGSTSVGGTGRDDGFAFFATADAEDALLNRLLAHEHLHTWIPRRLGAMPEHDEAADYWLSEGFTDFYTARLLLRDGLWGLKKFTDELNEALRVYAASSVRTAPNAKIIKDFWTDSNTQQLPYLRGQLLAMRWDHMLLQASDGARDLDDVVLAMKAQLKASPDSKALATELFAAQMQKAGVDVTGDLAALVRDGGAVLLAEVIFGPCGEVETFDVAEFDRGFDADKTALNENVIVGLREDSPGYRAGLRNGMKIVKREAGKPGDSRVALTYRVWDGGNERLITFLPEGSRRLTMQELVLESGMDEGERKVCVARLSGMAEQKELGFWSGFGRLFSSESR
ncbi:MAG: hypothetical protein SGJ03_16250 [Alphaproteobacteria bacterium]|nr:hypothetical protein [Alphaproteobacteria bacterium]